GLGAREAGHAQESLVELHEAAAARVDGNVHVGRVVVEVLVASFALAQASLEILLLADVALDGGYADHHALGVAHGRHGLGDLEDAAALDDAGGRDVDEVAARRNLGEHLLHGLALPGGHELHDRLADHLGIRIPVDARGRRVPA